MSATTGTSQMVHSGSTDRARRVAGARRARSVRRPRLTPVLWMIALAAFIVGVGVMPAAGDPVPSAATATIAIRVSPSDTLWAIAAAHRLPGVSTSEMVRLIREANSLSGAVLTAGETLAVPAEAMPDTAYAQVSDVSVTR